ncbi:Factor arrest protein 11 [Arachnomyces sp. PD_36]|nr:Factor arrest protein 11 [Arachnomyces sp. PD_36]
MENSEASKGEAQSGHLIVKADEVDQTGTDIATVPDDLLLARMAKGIDREDSSKDNDGAAPALPTRNTKIPARPDLSRESAVPPPPRQPPPPAPPQQGNENPTDSLSLVQLKRIVHELPKAEQPAYAFRYADSQPFPEELDEWFQYNEPDRLMLLATKVSFEQNWKSFLQLPANEPNSEISWLDASAEQRKLFFEQMINEFRNPDLFSRIESLEAICYALAGVWGSTAGKEADDYPEGISQQDMAQTPKSKSLQIKWIENNVLLLQECSGIPAMFEYVRKIFDPKQSAEGFDQPDPDSDVNNSAYFTAQEREANLILTCLYLVVEVGRRRESTKTLPELIKKDLSGLKPNFLVFLVEIIARLRWGDSPNVPLTRIVLLFWKSLLLLFGGTDSLNKTKEELEPKQPIDAGEPSDGTKMPLLTASPLDYHVFRQEITSKYPAYNPPPLVVPLELENNSILPPLPSHSRLNSTSGLFSGVGPPAIGGNSSILHQSVHIATPAPSPPPSPIGPGGKAGKKQNYQTNQNFPFMYPPLDDTSNNIGGRGSSEAQDSLVGKKWQGSDVPASIIEAGKLFSSRIKMTRAIRQLWEERERFMKFDRGWDGRYSENPSQPDSEEEKEVELEEELNDDPSVSPPKEEKSSVEPRGAERETDNEEVQGRLDAVEDFYRGAMPHLQSIVIVLLKVILTNVTAMVTQPGQGGINLGNVSSSVNGMPTGRSDLDLNNDIAIDELDNIRLREITGKAVSGSLLLLLKWFKRSHVLKFEYMTQLLLDSNYLPLILKMFAHQDVDKAIAQQNDREDMSFFHFCHTHSDHGPPQAPSAPEVDSPSSEDEAVPPPILRRPQTTGPEAPQRNPSPDKSTDPLHSDITEEPATRPEVDELGYPIAPHPSDPITTYSFRNFFSSINYLHIMQKITRDKAHRCLLLVQYKSSTILRKGIKIPDPDLRLYTLKLFKSQVPYCGRKWRQSNMRVITAIYLYCHPELRDDWLAGSDVDADVEEALPLEQALRGLTHWWHLRQYKDVTGVEEGKTIMDEERDFFVRELESMGWGFAGADDMSGAGVGDEGDGIGPGMNGTEWVSGPLMDGGYQG